MKFRLSRVCELKILENSLQLKAPRSTEEVFADTSPEYRILSKLKDESRELSFLQEGESPETFLPTLEKLERQKIVVPSFTGVLSGPEGAITVKEPDETLLPLRVKKNSPGEISAKSVSVLLIGGGMGPATVGLGHIASYLVRNGVDVKIWSMGRLRTHSELERELRSVLKSGPFDLVGISFKWFHHMARVLSLGAIIRSIDQGIEIVVGGNSASHYWRELMRFDFIDKVILGDGEVPLLAICQGETVPPNCVMRTREGVVQTPQSYVQTGASDERIFYEDLEDLFISKYDLLEYAPQVIGGKGCKKNCIFCGGGKPNQIRQFGRGSAIMREVAAVKKDVQEICKFNSMMVFDFTTVKLDMLEYMEEIFSGIETETKSLRLVSWEVPSKELLTYLSKKFRYAWALIDAGSYSERHRLHLAAKGYIKGGLTDAEIFDFIGTCDQFSNVFSGLYTVFGMPFIEESDFAAEEAFVHRVLKHPSFSSPGGNMLLQAQPGARVTEDPSAFGMHFDGNSFTQYLEYFEEGHSLLDLRVKYANPSFDERVVDEARKIQALTKNVVPRTILQRHELPEENDELLNVPIQLEHHTRCVFSSEEWYGARVRDSDETFYVYKNLTGHLLEFEGDEDVGFPYTPESLDDVLQRFEHPRTPQQVIDSFREEGVSISSEALLNFVRPATSFLLLKRSGVQE